jgi:hypothetical protein
VVDEKVLDRRRIERIHRNPTHLCDVIAEPIADEWHVHEHRIRRQSTVVAQILHVLRDQVVTG